MAILKPLMGERVDYGPVPMVQAPTPILNSAFPQLPGAPQPAPVSTFAPLPLGGDQSAQPQGFDWARALEIVGRGLTVAGSDDPLKAAMAFRQSDAQDEERKYTRKRNEQQDKIAGRKLSLEELKASKPVIQSSGVPGYSIAIYPDGRVEQIVNDAAVKAYQEQQDRLDDRQRAVFEQQQNLLDQRLQSNESIAAARQAASERKGARLNPSLQKEEDADFLAIDGAKSAASDIQPVINNLKTGTLQLGALRNAWNASRNFFGSSTPESQAYAELERGITRITNESLRLNKGVQTEGDAQRAAKEVLAAFGKNDTALMTAALEDLQRINSRAADLRARGIDRRRTSQGVEPIFGNQSPTTNHPPAPSGQNDPLGIRR